MAALSKQQHLIIGPLLIGLGAGVALMIVKHPESLRVPAWVAYAAVSGFPLSGLVLIAQALGAKRLVDWLGLLVIAGLVVPSLWIAFGPGPRKCSLSIGDLGSVASDGLCRAAFGVGSILGLIILVLAIGHAVSPKATNV